MTGAVPKRDAIQSAVEHLLAWPEIARSPQLGRFLDYIVQRTLAGEEQTIKAYSIAVDVFGRGADFDPQADPIVRVQARRLRSLIDDYYRGAGIDEPVQVRLPVGRYIPEFIDMPQPEPSEAQAKDLQLVPAKAEPSAKGGLTVSWYVLAVLAVGTAMGAYALSTWGPRQEMAAALQGTLQRPSISIVEFQNLAATAEPAPQVAGLAIALVTDLEKFENLRIFYRAAADAVITPDNLPVNDYVLTGIVRPDGAVVQYSAILTQSLTGTVVWNHTLSVPGAEAAMPGILDRVSRSFSLVLGSPRGPLHAPARQLPASGDVNPYLCRVMFDHYRETGSGSDARLARDCYDALPETDKQDAVALAADASLIAEYVDPATAADIAPADRFRMAQTSLSRAIGLNPVSGFIWEQQARLHEEQGMLALAQADFASAVQLNPANADALAAYARLLALAGYLDDAEQMAQDATELSPDPPPWYFGVPALLSLREGNYADAVVQAERYAEADRELGPVLAIMAAQASGDSAVVNRYLTEVLDMAAFRAKGVMPRLRERIGDDRLIDAIRSSLAEAGVPWASLTRPY